MNLEQAATALDMERPFGLATQDNCPTRVTDGVVVDISGILPARVYPPVSVAMSNAAFVADKDGFEDRPEFLPIRHVAILSCN